MVNGEVTRHRSGSSVQGVTRGAERSRASNEGYRWFTISEKTPTRIGCDYEPSDGPSFDT